MKYGPVLAVAFVLWPVMSALGGQGFAPLIGLTGIAALFVARPRLPPALFASIGFAFVVWAALSQFWSGTGSRFFSGSFAEGTFAVEARSVSMLLLALTSALTIAATLRAAPAPRASGLAAAMLGLQAALLIIATLMMGPVLTWVYGDDASRLHQGVQNIGRGANTLALGLPLLLPMLVFRWRTIGALLAAALTVAAFACFMILGSDSALFAMGGMAAAIGLVTILPRMGFRWLFGVLGGYIAAAPVFYASMIRLLDPFAQYLPDSFRSRLWSWEAVIGKMSESPFIGHGINATRSWDETFASRPDWLAQLPDFWATYRIVPGHPHNMALQIWAETGMIGAVVAALAVVALGFHLPRPAALRPEIRYAVAGLTGAAAVIFSFAYSLWNEGFWASLALAAAAIILWQRTLRNEAE